MSEYNVKNYTEQGGEVTHIGGKLVIDKGGAVEGLEAKESSYTLPIASADTLGGVKAKAKDTETVEVAVDEDGKLFAPAYPTVPAAPGNATTAQAGLVKQATAVSDPADSDAATIAASLKSLLAALRTAGVLAES